MNVAISVLVISAFIVGIVLLLWGDSHYDNRFIAAGLIIILAAILCVFANPSPCSDCGTAHRSHPCPKALCGECGQVIPEKDRRCSCQESVVETNKCCEVCGQEFVVNIEIDCGHTVSVEVDANPETAQSATPNCPKCNKGVASAFCPDCGYNMCAAAGCPSCDKTFTPNEMPSYCPDCGEKITEAAPPTLTRG